MIEPGERVTFADGYSFVVTEHGPLVRDVCADCGAAVYVGVDRDYHGTYRCSTCGRKAYGLPAY